MVLVGLTVRVSEPVYPVPPTPVCRVVVVPSDQVTVHGPLPVSAAVTIAELPLQIVVVPLTIAVAGELTVTTALPVKSAGCAAHMLTSLKFVTVYVVLFVGFTILVAGLTLTG